MGDRVKQAGAKVQELYGKLSRRTRVLLAVLLGTAVVGLAGYGIWQATRPYVVLFQDLSQNDLSAVLNYMDSNGITDYRVRNNDTILVPESQEYTIRAAVLMGNYTGSGSNYELYLTNVGALSSDSDRRTLQLYDLQNRLGGTIKSFDGVKDATVYISLGEDRRYILNSDNMVEASASVNVTMQGANTLTDQQANAIRNLVGNAVQGLAIDNISITDSYGNVYASGGAAATSDSAKLKLDMERQINAEIYNKVMEHLAAMFGEENVRVTVNATVDVSRKYEEATLYEEPDWALDAATGQGIVGRRVWGNAIVRDAGEGAGGVPGTTTNADLNEYVVNQSQLTGNESEVSTSGEVEYRVGTRTIQSDMPVGAIEDIYVSVVINSTNVSVPATADLVSIIAKAAGINEELEGDKIAVMAYPFYVSPPAPPIDTTIHWAGLEIQPWMLYAAVAGVVLFLVLILIILLLRARSRRKKAKRQQEELQASQEAAAAMAAAGFPVEGFPEAPVSETGIPMPGAAAVPGVPTVPGAPVVPGAPGMPGVMGGMGAAAALGLNGQPIVGADIMDLHTERSMELLRQVRQFVEDNPSIAAQMIKTWLRGGDEDA